MWISTAYAQAGGAAPNPLISFLPLILIFVVFYFLLIRPQQKRVKEHQAMQQALKRGDEIVTGGGVYGKVVKTEGEANNVLVVEIAQGVQVRVERSTVQTRINKEPPKAANDKKAEEPEKKGLMAKLKSGQ